MMEHDPRVRDALAQLACGDYLAESAHIQLARVITVLSMHQPTEDGRCVACGYVWQCPTFNVIHNGCQAAA